MPHALGQTPAECLKQADRFVDRGDWLRAAPLYASLLSRSDPVVFD